MKRYVINKYTIENALPLYCACVVYRSIYNYFIYLVPALEFLWVLIYNLVTLFGLVMFIPLALHVLSKKSRYRFLSPALIIPLCVVINILAVFFETMDFTILSRNHLIPVAQGTHDAYSYYFSQINTWFGNMTVVLMIALFSTRKETIKKCIISSAFMLFVPAVLMVIAHPELLGVRQSTIEGSDVVFGGGLWNIGVMGIGSVSWLGFSMTKDMTKRQRNFIVIAFATFAFLGIAGLSRSLILMLILSAFTYFWIAKKDENLIVKVLIVLIAVVALLVVAWPVVESMLGRFSDDTSGGQNVRFLLWKSYLSHFGEVWLVGAPYGSVYNYYRDVSSHGRYFLPHSAVINFLVRFGLLSMLSYFALIKNAFLSIPKGKLDRNENACIKAGCVAYVSLAFANQTGFAESVFFVMFGIMLAYTKILREES